MQQGFKFVALFDFFFYKKKMVTYYSWTKVTIHFTLIFNDTKIRYILLFWHLVIRHYYLLFKTFFEYVLFLSSILLLFLFIIIIFCLFFFSFRFVILDLEITTFYKSFMDFMQICRTIVVALYFFLLLFFFVVVVVVFFIVFF